MRVPGGWAFSCERGAPVGVGVWGVGFRDDGVGTRVTSNSVIALTSSIIVLTYSIKVLTKGIIVLTYRTSRWLLHPRGQLRQTTAFESAAAQPGSRC